MNGEAMMVTTVKLRGGWVGFIVAAELVPPPKEHQFEELHRTTKCLFRREAERLALEAYWPIYEQRHGWKHPEDPRRTESDPPPAGDVFVMRAA